MFTRISSALLLAGLLAACSEGVDPPAGTAVECAVGGSASFAPDCTMERASDDGASILIVRHPDGGFRRFELGGGIVTADGVEQAEVTMGEGIVEVRVGADRYRLPVAE